MKSPAHIPSLDGLRAISFALVFGAHAAIPSPFPWPGTMGVTVFFFLSGFLITTLLRLEQQKNGAISLKKFYLRRALRILPPFYLVLAFATFSAHVGLSFPGYQPLAVLAQALHVANYWVLEHTFAGFPIGTGVYWSLAVEEHFYLLFPWLFLLLVRLRASAGRQALILLGVCAVILGWRLWLVYGLHAPSVRTEIASDTRFDSLLFGCALALYENPAVDATSVREGIWKYVLLPLGLGGLLVSLVVRSDEFRDGVRYTLQGISLVPVFVCAIRYPTWLPMRPLNWKPVAQLGVLSYSLYLIHQVVIAIVHMQLPNQPNAVQSSLAFAGTLVLSIVMYQLVEKPCARLRKKLSA